MSIGPNPSRIGIVAIGTVVPAWQAELLRSLQKVTEVQLALYISTGVPSPLPSAPWPGSLLLTRIRRKARYAHLQPKDVAPLLVGTMLVHDVSEEEQMRAVAKAELDVLLVLDNGATRYRSGATKHGSWWFRYPEASGWTGLPVGLLEHIIGLPVNHLQLVRTISDTGHEAPVEILRQCSFLGHGKAPELRADAIFTTAACWPAQLLQRHGATPPAQLSVPQEPVAMELTDPGIWNVFAALFMGIRERVEKPIGQEEWNIGVLPQGANNLLEERPSLNVRWLPAPNTGSHRSEPFGYLDRTGELNVVYRKDVPDGPSRFARVRPKADNILKRSREFLQLGSSLSYPYVVEHEGEVFVVVSKQEEQVTELHRLEDTNTGLTPDRILLHEALEAPTLFMQDGLWWLMGTKAPLGSEALHLYSAEHLAGPYFPHPLNPVRIDAQGGRPAGTPFVHQGVLWRPGLDLSNAGHPRVVLNEVLQLDRTNFEERPLKIIGPFKGSVYPEGIRTICSLGDITLVDGLRYLSADQLSAAERRKQERRKERSRKR